MIFHVSSEWICGVVGLGAAYCIGDLHGLWMAWTQETRCRRWADKAVRISDKLYETELKGMKQ